MGLYYVLRREDGYALPYLLVIITLISIMLSGVIGALIFYNMLDSRIINKKKLDLACFSGLQYFISRDSFYVKQSETLRIDSVTVDIQKKQKGLYWEVDAKAKNTKDSSRIKYLLGSELPYPFENAVIISRPELNATTAGNTSIVGGMITTTGNISRGNFYGIERTDENYLKGNLSVDKNIKTKLFNDSMLRNVFYDLSDTADNYIEGDVSITCVFDLNRISNSIIYGNLTIEGVILQGKKDDTVNITVLGGTYIKSGSKINYDLEIISDSTISIEEGTVVENVIFAADKKISIKEHSHFRNVQLFSRSGIEINKCVFDYPSIVCLYVNGREGELSEEKINISSTVYNGTLMLISAITGDNNNLSRITIDKESKVQGLIYSENNLELMGTAAGIIYTFNFFYYREPTEYINWLVNLNIDRTMLDINYLLPAGFADNLKYKILSEKWIR